MANDTLDALAARVETLEGQVKEIFGRLNDKENSPAVLSTKLNGVLITLGEVKQAVGELKGRPSRLWDTIISGAITAVIAALVGIAATHLK